LAKIILHHCEKRTRPGVYMIWFLVVKIREKLMHTPNSNMQVVSFSCEDIATLS